MLYKKWMGHRFNRPRSAMEEKNHTKRKTAYSSDNFSHQLGKQEYTGKLV